MVLTASFVPLRKGHYMPYKVKTFLKDRVIKESIILQYLKASYEKLTKLRRTLYFGT